LPPHSSTRATTPSIYGTGTSVGSCSSRGKPIRSPWTNDDCGFTRHDGGPVSRPSSSLQEHRRRWITEAYGSTSSPGAGWVTLRADPPAMARSPLVSPAFAPLSSLFTWIRYCRSPRRSPAVEYPLPLPLPPARDHIHGRPT